jgi:hypothetical protein
VVQANMLANQTKAALLQLEVELTEDDEHAIASITAHLWRAELLTGVVEVDKGQIITKAGCCPLHQPGGCRLGLQYFTQCKFCTFLLHTVWTQ